MFMSAKLREMLETDLQKVRSLWIQVGFDLTKSDSIPELQRMQKHNPGLCFVMENDRKEIIGTVLGGFDGRRGWVHHLAIKKAYRNSGLGRRLMDKLVSSFEEKNVVKIKLEILQSNQGVLNFYKKLGWTLRDELTTMSLNLK